jgi:DNA repair exonuclease SbcCD nuclease subunit
MRIAIFSDPHCGFEEKGREEDSFKALEEALKLSLSSDLILIAGDIFDSRVPKQETFAKVARILSEAHKYPSQTRLVEVYNKDKKEISPLAFRGIPIVAIHGNHERRSRQLLNPVQTLEHAGLLINLHCATAVFEINGKRVAIHGMGAVPERYARDVLREWNPKPVKDAVNILMLHQSIGEYIYSPLEPPSLRLEDLPDGFDLYILGHLHWHELRDFKSGKLLLPGSLIPTVAKQVEAEQKKGIWMFTDNGIEFLPLSFQRRIYIREFQYSPNVKAMIRAWLGSLEEGSIVSVKVRGKANENVNFKDIISEFEEKLILKIKTDIRTEEIEEKVKLLEMIRENRLSPEDLGKEILRKNLEALGCKIKPDEIFDLLVAGDIDTAFNILRGRQKTLW